MSVLMRSVSGIRGIVGPSFSPPLIASYVNAFLGVLKAARGGKEGSGKIVIGRDTRTTGPMIESLVAAACNASGAEALVLGIATTPTVELLVTEQKADGGIIITASHNPIEWNALKFLTHEGIFLDEAQVKDLFARVDGGLSDWKSYRDVKGSTLLANADEVHIKKTLELDFIDPGLIRRRRFKVAYDGVNGAGSRIVPRLLEELGCEVHALHVEPNGLFPHNPEPTPENLRDLSEAVKKGGCQVGFATDPDADRCALVDEKGRAIGEEYTLALATLLVLKRRKGPVTVNLSTSRMVEDIAARFNVPVHRAKVGEINVTVEMKKNGSVIGGEGNGGVISPDLHYGRDGILAIAMTLQLLAESEAPLSGIVAEIKPYTIDKRKFDVRGTDLPSLYAELEKAFPGAGVDKRDGLRFEWEDRWVHVRPSNTEPVARIIAEAPTPEAADALCVKVEKALAQ